MQLIAQGHVQRAAQLLNTSQALLAELEALEQLASAAQQQADLANATSLTATVQVQALQAIANRLANLSTQLDATAGMYACMPGTGHNIVTVYTYSTPLP